MTAEKKQPSPEMAQDTPALREALRKQFINSLGLQGCRVEALRQDASVRNFFRVHKHDGDTAILMEARPPLEDTRAFELMQKKLQDMDLTVPEIYGTDHPHGLVLMEDFGDIRYFELVTGGNADLHKLYSLATDVLVHKAKADPKLALEHSVAYSDEYWLFRIEQFLIHYMPQVMKRTVSEDARAEFLGLYKQALDGAHKFNNVLLHGDYGAQNLYYLPERSGIHAVGLIDFQDMTDARGNMMGSPAFDLSFMLQDVRVTLPSALEQEMKKRFIDSLGIKDVFEFEYEYATIGAAQATKCLGLFARLAYVNNRPEYAQFIPICWKNLHTNLQHPTLKGIKDWFAANDINIEEGMKK